MENKITLGTLSSAIAQDTGRSKKICDDFVREFFKLAAEVLLEEETLKIKGFGTFKVQEVDSRASVDVNTGQPIEISSHKKIIFTPAKELASSINAPFEEFESVEMEDELPEEILNEEYGDENSVSDNILEAGSEEEGEDDEITYEAYSTIEKEKAAEHPVTPDSALEYNLEESEDYKKAATEESETEEGVSQSEEVREEIKDKESEETSEMEETEPVYVYEEDPEERKSRFGMGFLVGSISTFAVCAVVFMIGCFLDWWPVNFGDGKEAVELSQATPEEELIEQPVTAEAPEPEAEPVYDTVSTTRYLTTIAREHYGDFNFWPYIYLENESILGHPDRITPGTQVVVPDLAKYGIDPKNKEDVATAKKKALEIYGRFK